MTTKMEVSWSKLNKFQRNCLGFCKGNLDVKQVKNNENQGLYSNHVVKNFFDKWVYISYMKTDFLQEKIIIMCSGEKKSPEN